MVYAYSDLVERSRQWAQQAAAAGWISGSDAAALSDLDMRSPDSLFAAHSAAPARPLIVAFFGGTGVGKSSLLNRLAGAPVAKAGVERPTSKEVTLYHHRSVSIEHLPAGLPIEKTKLAHHDDDAQRSIVWIDMPDFDSTEHGNKRLVLQWLPHIDILIYVVSPERYRDSKAWRILQAEGGRHAWLFVLNQWDRGQPEQYDDFVRQLHSAGFENPLVMRTVCNGADHADEFRQLQMTLASLATGHTVEQLEQHNLQIRKQQLRQLVCRCLEKFGKHTDYRALSVHWQQHWPETAALVQQAMDWPLQRMAGFYAAREGDLIDHTRGPKNLIRHEDFGFWDEWAQNRFEDSLDELILCAAPLSIPVNPLKHGLQPLRAKAQKTVHHQAELAMRTALAKPGNGMQRFFLKFTRILEVVLPLAAMGWAGYRVLLGYYQSSLTHGEYLGVDFAVHSVLLIGLSWLVPFFIQKKIQPSLQKTALQGLKKGLCEALAQLDAEVAESLRATERQRKEYVSQAEKLLAECASTSLARDIQDETLARMLIPK
ncbi:MAG: GTPase [Gammaproteobacteria bacterium]